MSTQIKLIIVSLLLILTQSCRETNKLEVLHDLRDGRSYEVFHYGGQIWMAENLNYHTENGTWIYSDDTFYAEDYGRLYNWFAALEACPDGWRLPTHSEWNVLVNDLGGKGLAGRVLKSDEHLSLQLGGFRFAEGVYVGNQSQGIYWTGSEFTDGISTGSSAWMLTVFGSDNTVEQEPVSKKYGFSIRCLKDTEGS